MAAPHPRRADTGLGIGTEAALAQRIGALAREARAIAVITHDIALSVADRAVPLDRRGMEFCGPCRALMRDAPRLTRVGLPPADTASLPDWLAAACMGQGATVCPRRSLSYAAAACGLRRITEMLSASAKLPQAR